MFTATATGVEPVAGARVHVDAGNSAQQTPTDQSGRYRLTGLPAGRSVVTTTLDGYETDRRTLTLSGDVVLGIGVEARVSYTLTGTIFEVTPDGRKPVEDVAVYCDSCGSPTGHTFVMTDAAGFYSATVRGDTRFDIQVARR